MLGSVAEAEDVVQEALLRVSTALEEGERIESPRAYVATITTRLAIDELRSARARRETYVGEWLPEPIVIDTREDPAAPGRDGRLALARLPGPAREPLTRAARRAPAARRLRLRLRRDRRRSSARARTTPGSSRSGARRHVDRAGLASRPRRSSASELAGRFFAAAQQGDIEGAGGAPRRGRRADGDGGGKAPALARSLHGRNRVARTLRNWAKTGWALPNLTIQPVEINGQPGALFVDANGAVLSAMEVDIADGQIQGINSVVNPDKLRHLGEVGDAWALLEQVRQRKHGERPPGLSR